MEKLEKTEKIVGALKTDRVYSIYSPEEDFVVYSKSEITPTQKEKWRLRLHFPYMGAVVFYLAAEFIINPQIFRIQHHSLNFQSTETCEDWCHEVSLSISA